MDWLTPLLVLSWVAACLLVLFRRHDTFHTGVYDQGLYTQSVWNTSQGRWYANSFPNKPPMYLGDHFAPALAFIAPLFWLIPDARVLLAVKVVSLAVTVLPAYLAVRSRYPALAPILALCFVFSPTLYQTALDTGDFHDIVLAAPTLSLALYALHKKRLWLMCEALALTLLVREEMGVYVAAFGVYLVLTRPDWRRLGLAWIALGGVSVIVTTQILVPLLSGGFGYIYTAMASNENPVLAALLRGDVSALAALPGALFSPQKLQALGRFLVPVGGLPLIARGEQWLWLFPTLFLLAVRGSVGSDVGAFMAWYLAPLIPLAWYASAAALVRWPVRWARIGLAAMAVGTAVGFVTWRDTTPGTSRVDAQFYPLTAHDRIGAEVLKHVPPDAAVVAQNGLGVHLAARQNFAMFPWFNAAAPQWIILDAQAPNPYPLSLGEVADAIHKLQLDPAVRTVWEQDGYFVFLREPAPATPHQGPWRWGPGLVLDGFEVAQRDSAGAFQAAPTWRPGQELRVMLYWTALAPLPADYTVSVYISAPDGFVLAQDDARPGQGLVATSQLQPGQTIRDTHYLAPPADPPAGATLHVVVYDAATMTRLPPEAGAALTPFALAP